MAEETIGLKIKVDSSDATASVGSLKKQLREAQSDVQALSDKFGATSKEAINAAKRAGELKDKIGDARALVDAFNPDAKFKALTASLSGVAGGFGAVQGAMALFGNESENVQKTLLKVQSAMALSQGLQAVGESVDSFKQLGAVIKNQVSGAFSSLKGAIAATGLGLLVIGVGLLVANFEKVKEVITNLFPGLAQLTDKIKSIVQGITDFVGVTSAAKRETDALKDSIGAITNALDMQISELEAQGGRENEVYKLKKDRLNAQLLAVQGATDEEIKQRAKLNSELRILDSQEANRIKTKNDADKKELERLAAEKEAIRLDNENKEYQAIIDAADKRNELNKRLSKESVGIDGLTDTERKQKKEDEKAELVRIAEGNARLQSMTEESNKSGLGKILAIKAEGLAQDIKQTEEASDAKKHIDKLELESKEATAYAIADITAGLSSLIGQDTAAGKAIAISSATIDTYLAASSVFKQAAKNPITTVNPAYPYLMAAPAVLAGIARVKQIASVKVPGGGGGGGMPSMSSAAPIPPSLAQAAPTTLSQGTINDIGNQAVRAYVVETDVTSNQQRISAIQQRARFS